jgi:hypothetical protein
VGVDVRRIWWPPSLKTLFAVTSPIVNAELMVIVTDAVALEYVTPALLLILRVLKAIVALFPVGPVIVCADVPLKFTVPVEGVRIRPPDISRLPLIFRVPLPVNVMFDLFPPVAILPVTVTVPVLTDNVVAPLPPASTKVIVPQLNEPALTASVKLFPFVGEPEKVTAPVPPPTVNELVLLIVTVVFVAAPVTLICREAHEKAPSTVITVPLAMITASDDVGTTPPTQAPVELQF